MRLPSDPRFPLQAADVNFISQLTKVYRQLGAQLNMLTEGSIQAVTNAGTAAPTAGTYQKGDYIRNSNPSELGTTSSKYVVTGFICVTAGTPGTWLQTRALTGN